MRWVRRFLTRQALDGPLADQVRTFCEELERDGGCAEWQARQAEQALRIYFVNFFGSSRNAWRKHRATPDDLLMA